MIAPPRLALHPGGLGREGPLRGDQGHLPRDLPLRRGARKRPERVLLRAAQRRARLVQGPTPGQRW